MNNYNIYLVHVYLQTNSEISKILTRSDSFEQNSIKIIIHFSKNNTSSKTLANNINILTYHYIFVPINSVVTLKSFIINI